MFDEFSVTPPDDDVPRSTTPVIVSRSVQCETIDSFYTPRLDAEAPEFIPSHADIPVFTTSTAVVLARPTVSSMSDECVLELSCQPICSCISSNFTPCSGSYFRGCGSTGATPRF